MPNQLLQRDAETARLSGTVERQDDSSCLNVIVGGCQVHPTSTSIFDLSPSEKLQLVEDLWDDLAATPNMVPVHDWQKEELARRKANLMQNPASGLTWEEVKQRVRSRYGR
jgi:putative addiction module component (TIGR02574 family)